MPIDLPTDNMSVKFIGWPNNMCCIRRYAGPDTQQVTEEFKLDWSTYLTSSENVIYASIDGRGSSGRGLRFMHAVHRQLGTVEVQDQIAGARYKVQAAWPPINAI